MRAPGPRFSISPLNARRCGAPRGPEAPRHPTALLNAFYMQLRIRFPSACRSQGRIIIQSANYLGCAVNKYSILCIIVEDGRSKRNFGCADAKRAKRIDILDRTLQPNDYSLPLICREMVIVTNFPLLRLFTRLSSGARI